MSSPVEPGEVVPVQLFGGPLDGHLCDVRMSAPDSDVYLFRTPREGGGYHVWAYQFGCRTVDRGRRWVLEFLYRVARQGGAS